MAKNSNKIKMHSYKVSQENYLQNNNLKCDLQHCNSPAKKCPYKLHTPLAKSENILNGKTETQNVTQKKSKKT